MVSTLVVAVSLRVRHQALNPDARPILQNLSEEDPASEQWTFNKLSVETLTLYIPIRRQVRKIVTAAY